MGESVDLQFQNINYNISGWRNETKPILKDVSGEFRSGHMSCILGTSGSGKTTLLNILAGYSKPTSGEILINGVKRKQEESKNFTRYIFQENLMRNGFTVQELMMIAADLKLGKYVSRENKNEIIMKILGSLRLHDLKESLAKVLSGGEKKRLSVALELIDNPKVLIFDEPTTGLDNVASLDCIKLFKDIATDGRTVICSIHTPSEQLFSYFDSVYVINEGQCVYHGEVGSMLPFLNEIGLKCPISYNPADYMIEVCCKEYGDYQDIMVESTKTNCRFISSNHSDSSTVSNELKEEANCNQPGKVSSFSYETFILTRRILIQMLRDKYLVLRIVLQISIGVLIGLFFGNVGDDATKFLQYVTFIFAASLNLAYFASMNIIIWFHDEKILLKREFLNSWYGCGSYYTAATISLIPGELIRSIGFVTATYFITHQPMEISAFVLFNLCCFLLYVSSETLTFILCIILDNPVYTLFLSKLAIVGKLINAIYDFGRGGEVTPIWIRAFMYINDVYFGLNGMAKSTLGQRKTLPCPDEEEWCISDVAYSLKSTGVVFQELWKCLLGLCGLVLASKVFGFIVLKRKLFLNR